MGEPSTVDVNVSDEGCEKKELWMFQFPPEVSVCTTQDKTLNITTRISFVVFVAIDYGVQPRISPYLTLTTPICSLT